MNNENRLLGTVEFSNLLWQTNYLEAIKQMENGGKHDQIIALYSNSPPLNLTNAILRIKQQNPSFSSHLIKLDDSSSVMVLNFERIVNQIANYARPILEQGKKCILCCQMGLSRSVSIRICLLKSLCGIVDLGEALKVIGFTKKMIPANFDNHVHKFFEEKLEGRKSKRRALENIENVTRNELEQDTEERIKKPRLKEKKFSELKMKKKAPFEIFEDKK
jgi:protein-tyrosine phosphatase